MNVERTLAGLLPSRDTPRKALRLFIFQALASGSSGNAFLLRTAKVRLLVEAGLRLPKLEKYLVAEGVLPEELTAVLISHEHRDHCVSAADLAADHGVPIYANAEVLKAAGLHGLPQATVLEVGRPTLFGDVEVTTFPTQHDSVNPVGFLLRVEGRTIAVATDLGQPTSDLSEAVRSSDLVVLEANHDTELLAQSRYPYHLRRRVAGPTGHLSNVQAASILASHVARPDTEVWLAHLSKENNTPALALKTVRRCLKESSVGYLPIDVALRDRPSLRWNGSPRPRQLSLFAGRESA